MTSPEPLDKVLRRVQPQLRSMLARYSIPPKEAETLLRDVFLTFAYKRESVGLEDRWLLRNLRRRCILFWKDRKWQLYTRLDSALQQTLEDSLHDEQRRAAIVDELEMVLSSLPGPCRAFLRQRYGLQQASGGELPGLQAGLTAPFGSDRPEELEACLASLSSKLVEFGLLDDEGLVH